jgi:hypothetical protein
VGVLNIKKRKRNGSAEATMQAKLGPVVGAVLPAGEDNVDTLLSII